MCLAVALGPVVGFAEHLVVADVGGAALGPGGDMVGVHFQKFPDTDAVGIVADGTQSNTMPR